MIVQHLQLQRFRNHLNSELNLGSGANILFGNNGQGKTNVLEAISCLGLTKSFYATSDASLVQLGHETLEVEGTFVSDVGTEYSLKFEYSKLAGEKTFSINGARVERLASVIGMFPVVVLSPEKSAITFGGPADRRRFIDMVLSQLSRSYFDDLLEYRKILRQRNSMLAEAKQHGAVRTDILSPWDHGLAEYGARIIHKRMLFLAEFKSYVDRSYGELVEGDETTAIRYVSLVEATLPESTEAIKASIVEELEKRKSEECQRGLSLVGPHRDDLEFTLNEIDLQKFASQGQHKTFLIALKIAEFLYLKVKREETPILLFDDVLSELDAVRSERLLSHLASLGQSVVTTTDVSPFNDNIAWGHEHRKFYVEQGTCGPANIGNGKETTVGA